MLFEKLGQQSTPRRRITLTPTGLVDGEQFISLTSRFPAFGTIRRVAAENGVSLEERRIGLLSKRFIVRGSVYMLERFINAMCDEDPYLYDKLMAAA